MDLFFYEKEFKKRIKALKEIRKKAHNNEKKLIDDTISTMEDIIDYYKNSKKDKLVDAMENDYIFLKNNSFLWEYVRKFATMDVISLYGDYVFEDSLDLSDDEVIGLTHDFYKYATDKQTYETFLKTFQKRNKTLGIIENQTSDFVADSVYLPYYRDVYIQLNRKHTFEDICSLIHEYGHAVQFLTNYNSNLFDSVYAEIISVFFELISFEYYSKEPQLQISASMAQWDDFCSRVLFADDLTDEFNIIQQIKGRKKGHTIRQKITQYAKNDATSLQGFIDYNTSESFQYVIAELIGIELYMIYRKDKDKAMNIVHKMMNIDLGLSSEDYYNEIKKLGINLNQKTSEYQDHLLKRMRTIKNKIDNS